MPIHSVHLVVLLAHMSYNLHKKNITKTLRGTNQDIKHQLPDLFHLDEKCRDFIKIIRSVSFCIFVTFKTCLSSFPRKSFVVSVKCHLPAHLLKHH